MNLWQWEMQADLLIQLCKVFVRAVQHEGRRLSLSVNAQRVDVVLLGVIALLVAETFYADQATFLGHAVENNMLISKTEPSYSECCVGRDWPIEIWKDNISLHPTSPGWRRRWCSILKMPVWLTYKCVAWRTVALKCCYSGHRSLAVVPNCVGRSLLEWTWNQKICGYFFVNPVAN